MSHACTRDSRNEIHFWIRFLNGGGLNLNLGGFVGSEGEPLALTSHLYSQPQPLLLFRPRPKTVLRGVRDPCKSPPSPSRFIMAEKVNAIAPRDTWPFSTVTEEDLQSLVDRGLLRPSTFGLRPEWLVHGDEEELLRPWAT